MHRHVFMISLLLAAAFLAGSLDVRAQSTMSPREQLRQYVAQLQINQNNQDLREKIIKLALTIQPAPAIPDETAEPVCAEPVTWALTTWRTYWR
jgi:hypothetical protein